MATPDAMFSDPRLAVLYDDIDGERTDLDHYVAMVIEFGAATVLDVGCGTGSLACRLATADRLRVTAVDPAAASLDIARAKPASQLVTWVHGDATTITEQSSGRFDIAFMTGNVAQVFVDDADWASTLTAIRDVLAPDGVFAFETRDPSKRAWEAWDSDGNTTIVDTTGGRVETWTTLLDVSEPATTGAIVSFRHHYRFLDAPASSVLTSDSTLRFRTLTEIHTSLAAAGFSVADVRDAPDRPGREFVVIARPDRAD